MRLPTLGPKSVALIGVILCFLIASFFSGCRLDELLSEETGTGCTFYPDGPGNYNIIYHLRGNPKDQFVHKTFTSEAGQPSVLEEEVLDKNGNVFQRVIDCDGIESSFKL